MTQQCSDLQMLFARVMCRECTWPVAYIAHTHRRNSLTKSFRTQPHVLRRTPGAEEKAVTGKQTHSKGSRRTPIFQVPAQTDLFVLSVLRSPCVCVMKQPVALKDTCAVSLSFLLHILSCIRRLAYTFHF